MRRELVAVFLFITAGLAGCNGGFDPTQTKEGDYTILLKAFSGPDHAARAKYYKKETGNRTDWVGLYVVHEDNKSQLFYGRYGSVRAAQANLDKAKKWRAPAGIHIYAMAIVVPIPGEDIGPPMWNLRNATGTYTVVVAMFYNDPKWLYTQRKEDAVGYCKRLREVGVEAYFLHGPSKSYVSIGIFDNWAVESVQQGGQFVNRIRDDRMKAVIREYPKLAVNGREEYTYGINPKTNRREKIVSLSYPMRIPREEVPRISPEVPEAPGEQRPAGGGDEPAG